MLIATRRGPRLLLLLLLTVLLLRRHSIGGCSGAGPETGGSPLSFSSQSGRTGSRLGAGLEE